MSSNCQFWLSNDAGSDTLQIPVLPDKLNFTSDAKNDTVNVSNLGEVTILQELSSLVMYWDCYFPAHPCQGSIANPLPPQEYIDKIEAWRATKKPVKFLVTGTKINAYFSIESLNWYEMGGDPDTLYYTIKLKAYKEPKVRKLDSVPTISIGRSSGSSSSVAAASYQDGKVKTKGKRLKLYAEASKSSKVLAKMSNKSKLQVKSKSGDWYNVVYIKKNLEGYAQSKYVKIT